MSLKSITIQECQQQLLKIAIVFDQLCQQHQIPYYMLGGTMLGAIRHKGFIPWDDDMDFGIPRPYFNRFIAIAEQELPENFNLITNQNSQALEKGFAKIQLRGSKLIEKVFDKQDESFYNGIAIDVFPLDGVDITSIKGKQNTKIAFLLLRIQEGRFCSLSIRKGLKKIIASIIKKLPINDRKLSLLIEQYVQKENYDTSNKIANFYGHWKEREIIDKEIFGNPVAYTFENIKLQGVEQYDMYLKSLYHNYMELPPADRQITHADKFYIME